MISLCFLSAFIGYVYAYCDNEEQCINCDNELECIGDIGSDSGDSVNARGYKSLFQSPSSIAYWRSCGGALSCKQTPHIDTHYLDCYGTSSCSNSGFHQSITATGWIHGGGANSLMNANISIKDTPIYCYGDKSCAQSTISSAGSSTLKASGALSLFATAINILSGTFDAYLYGYYAGFQSIIHCKNGSICNIHCAYNGCGGLDLLCDSNAQCNITTNTTVALNTTDILFWNSTEITTRNEEECSTQTTDKTFDNYYDGKDIKYSTNVGPICCRAESACRSSSGSRLISYDGNAASVVCSGLSSCGESDIVSKSNGLIVECSADIACYRGCITGNGGTVYCYGYWSCYDTTITKISDIYCTGDGSCKYSNIASSGINITVYLTGYQSGFGASITCNENDHCTILCEAYQACLNLSLYCSGTCFVECNQDTKCPINSEDNANQMKIFGFVVIAVFVCFGCTVVVIAVFVCIDDERRRKTKCKIIKRRKVKYEAKEHPIEESYKSLTEQIQMSETNGNVAVANTNMHLEATDQNVDILAAAIISGYIETRKQEVKNLIFDPFRKDLIKEIPEMENVSVELQEAALKKVQEITVGDVVDDVWDIILSQLQKKKIKDYKNIQSKLTKHLSRQFSQLIDEINDQSETENTENIQDAENKENENNIQEEKP